MLWNLVSAICLDFKSIPVLQQKCLQEAYLWYLALKLSGLKIKICCLKVLLTQIKAGKNMCYLLASAFAQKQESNTVLPPRSGCADTLE